MEIIDTTLGIDLRDPRNIKSYWNDELIEALHFGPKKVSADMRDAALASPTFAQSCARLQALVASCPLASRYSSLMDGFARDAVRRYLREQGLRTKGVLGIDWRRVLRVENEE